MATEYILSYTASDIDQKLGQIDDLSNKLLKFSADWEQAEVVVADVKQGLNQLKDDLSNKLPKSPADWDPWTSEEQAAARERMSVENGSDFELLVDATLEEEANSFIVKFPKPVRECLYHVWFFNNNDDKTILQTRCVDSNSNQYCLLRYSNSTPKGYGYVLNGYFRYNGNILHHSIVGYAGESSSETWTTDVAGTGSYAYISYPTNMKLSKVDSLRIHLNNTSHVLNAGAVIRVWGR